MHDERINFVTVAESWHPVNAWLIRNFLADEGIDAFVVDDFMVSVDWLTANAVGGVKIQVPRDQALWAADVLDADASNWLPPPKTSRDPAIAHCQACRSVEVCAVGFARRAVHLSWLFLGFPIPIRSRTWRCLSCGARFSFSDEPGKPFQFSLMTLMTWVTIAALFCGACRMALQGAGGVNPAVGETRGH